MDEVENFFERTIRTPEGKDVVKRLVAELNDTVDPSLKAKIYRLNNIKFVAIMHLEHLQQEIHDSLTAKIPECLPDFSVLEAKINDLKREIEQIKYMGNSEKNDRT